MVEIAFGKAVPSVFKTKVLDVCSRLQCDPSFLMAAMAFETGERFKSNTVNKASGATGLIQFMPATARALGTTTAALAQLSEVDQLDWVEHYFRPFRGRLKSLSDLYMVILWPAAVGRPEAHAIFRSPAKTYKQNAGLDANHDGAVTKSEAAAKVQNKLTRRLANALRG